MGQTSAENGRLPEKTGELATLAPTEYIRHHAERYTWGIMSVAKLKTAKKHKTRNDGSNGL